MITRPDQYTHQNSSYAIVDGADVRGGIKDVASLTNGNLLAIPADKRKLRTALTNGTDNKIYVYSGADVLDANWGNVANWNFSAGNSLPQGGTAGQVLSKNSNTDYDVVWVNENAGTSYGSGSTDFANTVVNITTLDGISGINTKLSAIPKNLNGRTLSLIFDEGIHTLSARIDLSAFYNGRIILTSSIIGNTTINISNSTTSSGILLSDNNIRFSLAEPSNKTLTINYTNTAAALSSDSFISFLNVGAIGDNSSINLYGFALNVSTAALYAFNVTDMAQYTDSITVVNVNITTTVVPPIYYVIRLGSYDVQYGSSGRLCSIYVNNCTSSSIADGLFSSGVLQPTVVYIRASSTLCATPSNVYNLIVYSV